MMLLLLLFVCLFVCFGFDLFCVRWEGVVVGGGGGCGGGGGDGGVKFGPKCGVQQHPVLPSYGASHMLINVTN